MPAAVCPRSSSSPHQRYQVARQRTAMWHATNITLHSSIKISGGCHPTLSMYPANPPSRNPRQSPSRRSRACCTILLIPICCGALRLLTATSVHPLTPICHCTETFLGRAPDRTHDLTSKISIAHRVPCVGGCPDQPRSSMLELVVFRPSAPCPRSKSILDEAPSSLFVRLLLHRCTAGRLVPPRPSRVPLRARSVP